MEQVRALLRESRLQERGAYRGAVQGAAEPGDRRQVSAGAAGRRATGDAYPHLFLDSARVRKVVLVRGPGVG